MTEEPELSDLERFVLTPILILLSPVIVVVLGALSVFYIRVAKSVFVKMKEQPLYWLNWLEVKRMTRGKTWAVLKVLRLLSGGKNPLLIARHRSEETLGKLRYHRSRSKIPPPAGPLLDEDVIFYEFRLRVPKQEM
jgi:hypothetical protein